MRRIHVGFTAKNITGNAGLILFGQFAEKLNIKKVLDQKITIKRGANADYTMGDIITMLMMGVLAGAKHMSHAENHECLHNWFRCGSAYTANGVVEFMKECFARLPERIGGVFVRADSGFFNGNLLDFLDEKRSQYLIKMKNLAGLLMSQNWQKAKGKPGVETAEFQYQCHGWRIPRRFVAIRILTDEGTNKGTFSPMPEYEFFCYVTNGPGSPWNIHKLYGKRATSENWIQWCKGQMASGSIRTQDFWANSAIFQSCIFAYNLMVWMMWLTTEEGLKEMPS